MEELGIRLARLELFRDLNEAEIQWLSQNFEELTLEEGAVLFREGESRTHFYLLEDGEVSLGRVLPSGRPVRLITFVEGEHFGEGCFIDDSPHSTTARAVKPTRLLVITKDSMQKMAEEEPTLFSKILKRVSRMVLRRLASSSSSPEDSASRYMSGQTRREHDFLGYKDVPSDSFYGIQTLRAMENFTITGVSLSNFPRLIRALAVVKIACARANAELGLLKPDVRDAIVRACEEILEGKLHNHFVVDMVQGGAGTSTNMNINEVVANRALELLGHARGEYQFCHPNNHVNLSQSTNDVYPTALKLALLGYHDVFVADLKLLIEAFRIKAREFQDVIKMGRTQLQDAVPMTLGMEFRAWARQLEDEVHGLTRASRNFTLVNMGGTAIGTGINADPQYGPAVVGHLRTISGYDIRSDEDLIASTSDTGPFVEYSNALKRLAIKLSRISNDLRLLSSGPRTGLAEIRLPEAQPGSSIMPGKVNPVIPEVVNQIAFRVIGNDLSVSLASEAGQLELNVMEPIIAYSILESMEMLINGMNTLRIRCIDGIEANRERCRSLVMGSAGIVTALAPHLGYEACSDLAKESLKSGIPIADLVLQKGLMEEKTLKELLRPENMLMPHPMKS